MAGNFFEELPEEPQKQNPPVPPTNFNDPNQPNNGYPGEGGPNNGYPGNNYPHYGYSRDPWGNNDYRPQGNSLSTASLVFGILSVGLCFCLFISLPCSIIAIILGILSKKGRPMEGKAIAGIVLGVIGLVIFVVTLINAWYLLQDPEFIEYLEELQRQLEAGQPIN